MSDTSTELRQIKAELRQIREALDRIANHVDPDGKRPPKESVYERRGARFV